MSAKGPSSSPRASHRLRPAAAWALAIACVATGACAGRYRPTTPLTAQSGDVQLTVESWHPSVFRELVLRSWSQTAHTIRAGWNTVATRDPCSGGEGASRIAVDAQSLAGESVRPLALPPGEHQIRVDFPSAPGAFEIDTVVDLEIDDHACLRVPAISQHVPMRSLSSPVVLSGMDIVANSKLDGPLGAYVLTVGVGRWFGPTLITAAAGIGGSTCDPDFCGRTSDGAVRAGLTIPFLLETRSLVRMFDGPTEMASMLTAGARYSFMATSLPYSDGARRFGVHGLQAVPGWWLVTLPHGPFAGGEHGSHMELSAPVGVAFEPSATSRRFAVTFGLGFRFVFPVL